MERKNNNTDNKDNNNTDASKIPDKSTTKPMDSKQDVEKSNDPKTDQDFPGYPHYPAKEDIMDQRTDSHRVDADVENLPNSRNVTGLSQRFATQEGNDGSVSQSGMEEINQPAAEDEEPLDLSRSTDGDVTPEERMALENVSMPTQDAENLRRATLDNTDFDGDELNEDSFGEVLSSADLDIPDEGDETNTEAMGQGDEENKYYSLGSDRHDAQEEDPQSGPNRDNY